MTSPFKLALVITAAITFASCGATKRVFNITAFKSFRTIGAAPYQYSHLPSDLPKSQFVALAAACDDTLLASLRQLPHVEKTSKILDDTLFHSYGQNDSTIFEYAKVKQIDGLLFCSIRYQDISYMFVPTTIAETRLLFVDVKSRTTVVDLRYNNRNDVGVNETYEATTKLSVGGAVEALIKELKKK